MARMPECLDKGDDAPAIEQGTGDGRVGGKRRKDTRPFLALDVSGSRRLLQVIKQGEIMIARNMAQGLPWRWENGRIWL